MKKMASCRRMRGPPDSARGRLRSRIQEPAHWKHAQPPIAPQISAPGMAIRTASVFSFKEGSLHSLERTKLLIVFRLDLRDEPE